MTTERQQFQTAVITGNLRYPKVLKPGTNYNGGLEYSVEVTVTDNIVEQLRAMGLSKNAKVRVDEATGLKYLKFILPATDKNGNEMSVPVVDTKGNDITTPIGNGSTGKVKVTFLPGGKFGSTARLTAIVVVDHIPYEPTGLTAEQQKAKALEGMVTATTTTTAKTGFEGI